MLKLIKFSEAKQLIHEGDILLFRGRLYFLGFIPNASWIIATLGKGLHTHVGMASWSGNVLECVEFREFKGGRATSLSRQVDLNSGRIDVFRIRTPSCVYNLDGSKTVIEYDGHAATQKMREMTGLPYSTRTIFSILKYCLFGRETFLHPKFGMLNDVNKYVCSNVISLILSQVYLNPYPLKPMKYISPTNLANSAILQYMFTLETDNGTNK